MIKNILSAPDDIKNFSDNFAKITSGFDKIKETEKALKMLKSVKEALEKEVDKETGKAIVVDMKSMRG